MNNKTNLFDSKGLLTDEVFSYVDIREEINLLAPDGTTVVVTIKHGLCEISRDYKEKIHSVLKMNIEKLKVFTANISPTCYYFIPTKLKDSVNISNTTSTNLVIELEGDDSKNSRLGNYLIIPLRYSSEEMYGFGQINNEDLEGNEVGIILGNDDWREKLEMEIEYLGRLSRDLK